MSLFIGMGKGACFAVLIFLFAVFIPGSLHAADFDINPVRVFFDPGQKASVIKIKNNGEEKFSLQLTVFEWSQDAEGKDVYVPTKELIAFPKILSVGKDEERLIRVGMKTAARNEEKTFRIYLDEIPVQETPGESSAKIRTLMRVGLPVFLAPLKPSAKAEILEPALSKGTLSFVLRNSGNVHFMIRKGKAQGVDAAGITVFETEIVGRYILQGNSRRLSTPLAQEDCKKASALNIEITTDRATVSERMDVLPEMCSP